ncbi:MAG: hypothetical protein WAV00_06745 [Nocardioides sp.]
MTMLHLHPVQAWGEAAGAALLLMVLGGGVGLLTGYAVVRLLGLHGLSGDTELGTVLDGALRH